MESHKTIAVHEGLYSSGFTERHYTVAEVAELWNISPDLARRIFENEPGVLAFGRDQSARSRRRYLTLRIPESVLVRVHRRLSRL